MKKPLLILLVAILTLQLHAQQPLSPAKFKNPPRSAKVHTWWHWMDGNITREGITKDLEAMKEQGIVQATIFNVGKFGEQDFGIKKVNFNTPEWYDMFGWAVKEAGRLGITIGVHNCDGFSSSAGTWITPEMSMKQYVWTKAIVNGTQTGSIKLKQPAGYLDFYKDVAVVAFRTDQIPSAFQQARPTVQLNDSNTDALCDGCPTSGVAIQNGDNVTFEFKKPFTAEKLAIIHYKVWGAGTSKYNLSVSDDGKNYKNIAELAPEGANKVITVTFKKITARFFRLTAVGLDNYTPWGFNNLTLTECELLSENEKTLYADEIKCLPEKTSNGKSVGDNNIDNLIGYTIPSTTNKDREVVDLTSKMNSDGTLNWKPAQGNWSIIRFGYTTTTATNSAPTTFGKGLECDKLDTTALNFHFKNFPAKLIEKAGPYLGNTLKFMLIDSWEIGYQNWTAGMMKEFEQRRGYSLIHYIPVLCGESSGNTETDEAVLYDFRKTIADLLENNYFKHFGELLHRNKLGYHAEALYDGTTSSPPLDILKANQYIDVPMFEFWASYNDKKDITYFPADQQELNIPFCAAMDYEKPVVAAEAYTGDAHYSEAPGALKPIGDRAFCIGINQMVLHSYVLQPDDRKPGMTLGYNGSHFNRNNSYWPFVSEWFNYQSRIQDVLQQGTACPDLMYYLGDQLPVAFQRGGPQFFDPTVNPPFGFLGNVCNYDVLKNRIEVMDGKLVLNGKTAYSALVFSSSSQSINFETLNRLEELVKQGAVIYAPKPRRMLGLKDVQKNRKTFAALVDKIWGNIDGKTVFTNNYGKGRVYWGKTLAEVLNSEGILPDLTTGQDDATNLMFIHKKLDRNDVYFVMNQQNHEINREISFRITGKTPEIWDPENGNTIKPAIYTMDKDYTTLPVQLKPYQSLIFVFRNEKPVKYIQNVKVDGNQVFPAGDTSKEITVPTIVLEGTKLVAYSSQTESKFELIDNLQKNHTLKSAKEREFILTDYSGKITFEPGYTATIQPVEFKQLQWLTDYENPDIKYFSGTAKYVISFVFPVNKIQQADSVLLDLGEFGTIGEVKLNGTTLGHVWKPGTCLPVKGILKAENVLEVAIADTYRNRFIGDFAQFGKVQNLWTSAPISNFLGKDSPLEPSGLKGPMRIITMSKQVLK